jgi:hypothetical protein
MDMNKVFDQHERYKTALEKIAKPVWNNDIRNRIRCEFCGAGRAMIAKGGGHEDWCPTGIAAQALVDR